MSAMNNVRHDLLNCDDTDDGYDSLKEFYARNLHHLMLFPMPDVNTELIRKIAVLLERTLEFKADWPKYVADLGITDNYQLAKIEISAKDDQPLFIALKKCLPHKMLGHVIDNLLNSKRYDVLSQIQPEIERLIETGMNTEVKEVETFYRQSSELMVKELLSPTKEFNGEIVPPSKSCADTDKPDTIASDPALSSRHDKEEITLLQRASTNNEDLMPAIQNISIRDEPSRRESSLQELNLFPSDPGEDRITVFIPHTEKEIHTARKLCTKFQENRFVAYTLADMEPLVAGDNTREVLRRMYQKVDFVTPVVSELYLQQIHSDTYGTYIESTDAKDNKLLYKLMDNEYLSNNCVNFRVRPVIVPNMNSGLLVNDIILSYAFRLWSEVPKLIRILRETKENTAVFLDRLNQRRTLN